MKTSDKSFIRSLFLFIVKNSGQTYNRLITKRYSKEKHFTVDGNVQTQKLKISRLLRR